MSCAKAAIIKAATAWRALLLRIDAMQMWEGACPRLRFASRHIIDCAAVIGGKANRRTAPPTLVLQCASNAAEHFLGFAALYLVTFG